MSRTMFTLTGIIILYYFLVIKYTYKASMVAEIF